MIWLNECSLYLCLAVKFVPEVEILDPCIVNIHTCNEKKSLKKRLKKKVEKENHASAEFEPAASSTKDQA